MFYYWHYWNNIGLWNTPEKWAQMNEDTYNLLMLQAHKIRWSDPWLWENSI
jgi:hypothetical protein